MSWNIEAQGTPAELREAVHTKMVEHAGYYMPRAERLIVGHLLGHAVEAAEDRWQTDQTLRFRLSGYGHEYGGVMDHHVSLTEVTPAPDEPHADPTT